MNDQANALWPWVGVHGWKCSETMNPAEKPAFSTLGAHSRRSEGWNCSSIAA